MNHSEYSTRASIGGILAIIGGSARRRVFPPMGGGLLGWHERNGAGHRRLVWLLHACRRQLCPRRRNRDEEGSQAGAGRPRRTRRARWRWGGPVRGADDQGQRPRRGGRAARSELRTFNRAGAGGAGPGDRDRAARPFDQHRVVCGDRRWRRRPGRRDRGSGWFAVRACSRRDLLGGSGRSRGDRRRQRALRILGTPHRHLRPTRRVPEEVQGRSVVAGALALAEAWLRSWVRSSLGPRSRPGPSRSRRGASTGGRARRRSSAVRS